jgi:hypothetical protein
VARSLFNLLPGSTPEHLALRQSELKRVITAVVAIHPDVHYYQGLHDVAGVLVLVLGEHAAYVHLDRLVQHHLRDCTRYTPAPASPFAGVLQRADRAHVRSTVYEARLLGLTAYSYQCPQVQSQFGDELVEAAAGAAGSDRPGARRLHRGASRETAQQETVLDVYVVFMPCSCQLERIQGSPAPSYCSAHAGSRFGLMV